MGFVGILHNNTLVNTTTSFRKSFEFFYKVDFYCTENQLIALQSFYAIFEWFAYLAARHWTLEQQVRLVRCGGGCMVGGGGRNVDCHWL